MARIFEPAPEQIAGYHEWVRSRPDDVRRIAERFQPWELYRLKPTGQVVRVLSFSEGDDGAVSVKILAIRQFNFPHLYDLEVFGIDPDELEPCDDPTS